MLLSIFNFSPVMAENDAVIGHVSLDGLYYNLNTEEQTAAVTWEVKDNAAICTGLTEIVLPDGVTKIPRAFTACSALRSVTVGNAVTEIGMTAFGQCTALETFTCHTVTPPSLVSYPFLMTNLAAATLHVPEEAIEAYQAATAWQDFGRIVAITAQGLEGIETSETGNTKRLVNGRQLIEKDGNVYSVTGQDVRQ